MSSFGGQAPPSVLPIPPPAPVNAGLNSQFTSLFGGSGGAGAVGVNTLTATARGDVGSPGSASDVSSLFTAITAAGKQTHGEDIANIESSFASTGAGISTDLMRSLARSDSQYEQNLLQTHEDLLFKSSESAKSRQLGAANILEETFGNAAFTYAPTGQAVSGATGSNLGGAAIGAGAQVGGTFAILAALGFL